MSNSYVPTRLELTVFVEANRLDFKLDGPQLEGAERTSVFFDKVGQKHILNGQELVLPKQARKANGHLVDPGGLTITLDGKSIRLPKAKSGKTRYYKPLETANEAAAPKTPAELFNALGI